MKCCTVYVELKKKLILGVTMSSLKIASRLF